jgi:putative membrane protein
VSVPYCGSPPIPGTLLERFNLDPILILTLLLLAMSQLLSVRRPGERALILSGWTAAAVALISPLCALSVSLFSARIAQHMALILIAAPLLALGAHAGAARFARLRLWGATTVFFVALWFWHMPQPYNATFESTTVYWAMHVSLFGSGVWLWREILHCEPALAMEAIAAGVLTSMQMGLLGAVLTLAAHPWFFWHLTTTQVWGLSPLEDQQLGGVFMWVPGIALFLWAALRTLERVRLSLAESAKHAR